jgi:hypothetical protein
VTFGKIGKDGINPVVASVTFPKNKNDKSKSKDVDDFPEWNWNVKNGNEQE